MGSPFHIMQRIVSGVLKDKQAGSGLHKRTVPCRWAAVYKLTYPATKATPWPVRSTGFATGSWSWLTTRPAVVDHDYESTRCLPGTGSKSRSEGGAGLRKGTLPVERAFGIGGITSLPAQLHKNLTRAGEGMRRYFTMYLIKRRPTAALSQDREPRRTVIPDRDAYPLR